ncbi:hypothetical protein GGQ10_002118 [Salinibacter ruber]|uniref:hypothetical protein n=1 Tax=Salinibacter ruber TaxID=146919 RepID=UPI00216943FA|nr:hypothetical protein [Salinibacter ruber]MCS4087292.1 hypothetical protein [Salinibacter ruber]
MISFEKLDDVSSWSGRTEEIRYCPLSGREFKVAEHRWPAVYLDGHFTFFVN